MPPDTINAPVVVEVESVVLVILKEYVERFCLDAEAA